MYCVFSFPDQQELEKAVGDQIANQREPSTIFWNNVDNIRDDLIEIFGKHIEVNKTQCLKMFLNKVEETFNNLYT